ncbi:MAG: 3-deoxy-manno-octulosonate cytidylyltransferase [Saprospiraceae bacterium]|nr:3-deoxy-manno-octulosonate cytidylyltransferase [Saprospiraceae bacterium]
MKTCIIIPSRLASTRLPEKALADILGKSLIQRVYEQASLSKEADDVIVATDHDKIFRHVQSFGGKVIMTSPEHQSGTDRISEVAANIDADILINVQGDEPLINPHQIDELIRRIKSPEIQIATQKYRITDPNELFNYNIVKVITDRQDKVLYFSRQAVPGHRDLPYRNWLESFPYYKHVGIYAFKRKTLLEITQLPLSPLENAESLEQLRWLENGYPIHCFETKYSTVGVDTEEDVDKVNEILIKEMNYQNP